MPSIYEVVEDAGAAIERFDEASSPAEQRRTMREVLAHLYSLHQHWVGKSDPAFTRAVAAVGSGGDVAQGVLYARGKITHNITREVGPRLQGTVYDPAVYDMRHYEAGTLTWLRVDEMTPEDRAGFLEPRNKHGAANLVHYRRAVAGQPVRDTLMTARDFLVAPTGMPTLLVEEPVRGPALASVQQPPAGAGPYGPAPPVSAIAAGAVSRPPGYVRPITGSTVSP